jgi:hypothetical protein
MQSTKNGLGDQERLYLIEQPSIQTGKITQTEDHEYKPTKSKPNRFSKSKVSNIYGESTDPYNLSSTDENLDPNSAIFKYRHSKRLKSLSQQSSSTDMSNVFQSSVMN